MVYKKECQQLWSGQLCFLAPRGRAGIEQNPFIQENLREQLPVMFLVCAIKPPPDEWGNIHFLIF